MKSAVANSGSDKTSDIGWEKLNNAEKILRKIEKKAHNELLTIVGPEKGAGSSRRSQKGQTKTCLGSWHANRLLRYPNG